MLVFRGCTLGHIRFGISQLSAALFFPQPFYVSPVWLQMFMDQTAYRTHSLVVRKEIHSKYLKNGIIKSRSSLVLNLK